jgi:hypothetical protein
MVFTQLSTDVHKFSLGYIQECFPVKQHYTNQLARISLCTTEFIGRTMLLHVSAHEAIIRRYIYKPFTNLILLNYAFYMDPHIALNIELQITWRNRACLSHFCFITFICTNGLDCFGFFCLSDFPLSMRLPFSLVTALLLNAVYTTVSTYIAIIVMFDHSWLCLAPKFI